MSSEPARFPSLGRAGEPGAASDARVSEAATFWDYAIIIGGWALLILWTVVGVYVGPF